MGVTPDQLFDLIDLTFDTAPASVKRRIRAEEISMLMERELYGGLLCPECGQVIRDTEVS